MSYRNAFDRSGQNQAQGEKAESYFKKIALEKGLSIQEASEKQQKSHIDFIISDPKGKKYFLDVKSRKKTSRTSSFYRDDLVWIEFKNVAGNQGWLYGASDYIAFEREDDFVVVPRKALATLCERIVSNTKVEKSDAALYNLYTRSGRKDELSLIKMDDVIKNIKVSFWKK